MAQVRRGQGKANLLQLVVLDTANGNTVAKPQTVTFPDWIAIDGGIGLTFAASATMSDDVLELVWQANREYAGQVPLKPEEQTAMRKLETGTAQIDLKQGVSTVSVDDYPVTLKTPRRDAVLRRGRQTLLGQRHNRKNSRRSHNCASAAGVPRQVDGPAAVAS